MLQEIFGVLAYHPWSPAPYFTPSSFVSHVQAFSSVSCSHALVSGPTWKRPASHGGLYIRQVVMMWSAVCSGSLELFARPHFFTDALKHPTPMCSRFSMVHCRDYSFHAIAQVPDVAVDTHGLEQLPPLLPGFCQPVAWWLVLWDGTEHLLSLPVIGVVGLESVSKHSAGYAIHVVAASHQRPAGAFPARTGRKDTGLGIRQPVMVLSALLMVASSFMTWVLHHVGAWYSPAEKSRASPLKFAWKTSFTSIIFLCIYIQKSRFTKSCFCLSNSMHINTQFNLVKTQSSYCIVADLCAFVYLALGCMFIIFCCYSFVYPSVAVFLYKKYPSLIVSQRNWKHKRETCSRAGEYQSACKQVRGVNRVMAFVWGRVHSCVEHTDPKQSSFLHNDEILWIVPLSLIFFF